MQEYISTHMPDRVKLNLTFNTELLQEDLRRLQSSDWIGHFVKQNYDGEWSVIPLRGPATATHPVMMIYSDPTCTEFSDAPENKGQSDRAHLVIDAQVNAWLNSELHTE